MLFTNWFTPYGRLEQWNVVAFPRAAESDRRLGRWRSQGFCSKPEGLRTELNTKVQSTHGITAKGVSQTVDPNINVSCRKKTQDTREQNQIKQGRD